MRGGPEEGFFMGRPGLGLSQVRGRGQLSLEWKLCGMRCWVLQREDRIW